jgi:hypothetical protein
VMLCAIMHVMSTNGPRHSRDHRPGSPRDHAVVGGRRHAQGADRLDPEAAAVLLHVAAHFVRSGSSSLAKNTEANFRISCVHYQASGLWSRDTG